MKLSDHVAQDMMIYGTSFENVHRDLDKTAVPIGNPHRKDTHFLEYVLEKVEKGEWGPYQARSAIQHIIDDCGQIMIKDDWKTAEDFNVVKDTDHGPRWLIQEQMGDLKKLINNSFNLWKKSPQDKILLDHYLMLLKQYKHLIRKFEETTTPDSEKEPKL